MFHHLERPKQSQCNDINSSVFFDINFVKFGSNDINYQVGGSGNLENKLVYVKMNNFLEL